MPQEELKAFVYNVFHKQLPEIGKDTLTFSQAYKDIGVLKNIDARTWLEKCNQVIVAAVKGLSGEQESNFNKCLAVEQMYSLPGRCHVSPFSFLTNIVLLTITNSKLAVNLFGKASPGGSYHTLRN